ncbi:hypothetical protein ALC62_04212 [Cyphomyrmex costatus]|uniref:Uncharacterized protein n=1 Tax=Cyphomyrmex costatus TaxID=456900 RepID=A0A195CVW8_9HYME|nr:hypothetical protein ALC62_04212 [Cyphomyrmex costatus]
MPNGLARRRGCTFTATEEDGRANAKNTKKKKKKLQSLSRGEKLALSRRQCYRSYSYLALRRYYPRPFLFGEKRLRSVAAQRQWPGRAVSYRLEGSIENHRENGEDGRTFGNNVKMGRRKWSGFITAPEVVFVRSAKTEVRRRKRPSKVASEAHLRNETINESLLMNKIVGRVADRSACNRKENRIKRALNGAIIHGNGNEGKHVDLNNRSTFAAAPTTKPIGKSCTEREDSITPFVLFIPFRRLSLGYSSKLHT